MASSNDDCRVLYPFSGEKDERDYIPVKYEGVTANRTYDVKDIAKLLDQGKRIVLLGNYGTGKSRCIQEIFGSRNVPDDQGLIISIDLRENWGTLRQECLNEASV